MGRFAPSDYEDTLDRIWAAFVSSPAAVAVVGPNGQILRHNRPFATLLRHRGLSLTGRSVPDLLATADSRGTDVHGSPLPPGQRELRWRCKDGALVACATSTWLVTGPSGDALYVDDAGLPLFTIYQLEDVSDRDRLSTELVEAEARFQLLVQSIREYAIYQLDPEGRISTWNSGAERIKGYRADEIIGRHYRVFFSADDAAAGVPERNLQAAALEGQAMGEDWRLRKDGRLFWAGWSITALRRNGRLIGFAKVTRDLSEKRAAQQRLTEYAEELERTVEQLEEAKRFQEDLLNVANHEFRTPLTALLGFSETLLAGWSRMSDEERVLALRAMATASQRMSGLVDNLVALSNLRSGLRTLHVEPVPLLPSVRDAATQTGTDLSTAAVDVSGDLMVMADPSRLRQVVGNLLTNAEIYGGGVREVAAHQLEGEVTLEVADHGPGVSEEFASHLFERFSQASRGSTRTSRGTGLGLASVRELARAMGGDAEYRPNQPSGARFVVRLPAA